MEYPGLIDGAQLFSEGLCNKDRLYLDYSFLSSSHFQMQKSTINITDTKNLHKSPEQCVEIRKNGQIISNHFHPDSNRTVTIVCLYSWHKASSVSKASLRFMLILLAPVVMFVLQQMPRFNMSQDNHPERKHCAGSKAYESSVTCVISTWHQRELINVAGCWRWYLVDHPTRIKLISCMKEG